MGLRRHRHDRPAGTTYQMREKMFSIGDDYWIEDDAGRRAYRVDGKALRVRRKIAELLADLRDLRQCVVQFHGAASRRRTTCTLHRKVSRSKGQGGTGVWRCTV